MEQVVRFDEDLSSDEPSTSEISEPSAGSGVQARNLVPSPLNKGKLSSSPPSIGGNGDGEEIDDNNDNVSNGGNADDDQTDAECDDMIQVGPIDEGSDIINNNPGNEYTGDIG